MVNELHYFSDTEFGIALWRHFSPDFVEKTLILAKHHATTENLEKVINQDSLWRISEDEIQDLFKSSISDEQIDSIHHSLSKVVVQVRQKPERGWISELLHLNVNQHSIAAASYTSFSEHLDLICCMISCFIDQSDTWSITRLLSSLCPSVLPSLRRLSGKNNLTILQTFVSYIMEAQIKEDSGSDEHLAEHIELLKSFDKAIEQMHDDLMSSPNTKSAIFAVIQTAANFLLSSPKYNCCSKIKEAQKFSQSQVKELVDNAELLNKIAPNKAQKGPQFLNQRDKVLRSLVDRLTCMDIAIDLGQSMTPVFKTPKSRLVKPEVKSENPVLEIEDTISIESRQVVDLSSRDALDKNSADEVSRSSTIDDLLDENKENINPYDQQHRKSQENRISETLQDVTPQRPKPARLSIGAASKRSSSADKNDSKKKSKQLPSQRSITSFFNSK